MLEPIKNRLPLTCPSGVFNSTTSIELPGTVAGADKVVVNNVPDWLGTATDWLATCVRVPPGNAPALVYNLTFTVCVPPAPMASSIPNVTLSIVTGNADDSW